MMPMHTVVDPNAREAGPGAPTPRAGKRGS